MRGPEQCTPADQQQFGSEVHTGLHKEADLRAGQLSAYVPVWEDRAAVFPADTELQEIVQLIRGGVQLDFCAHDDAHKALEPRHEPRCAASAERCVRQATARRRRAA